MISLCFFLSSFSNSAWLAGCIFVRIIITNVQAASQLLQLHASVPATAAAAPIPAVAAAAPIPAVAAAAPIPAVAAVAPIPAVAAAAPVPAVAAAAPIFNHGPRRGKFLVILQRHLRNLPRTILGIYGVLFRGYEQLQCPLFGGIYSGGGHG